VTGAADVPVTAAVVAVAGSGPGALDPVAAIPPVGGTGG
jgi:hypothetical protein